MKCDLCHQPTTGVCTRPHDAKAVARWVERNIDRSGYRLAPSPAPTPNVERVDEDGIVSLIVTGRARHMVINLPPWPTQLGFTPLPDVPVRCPDCNGRMVDLDTPEPWCPECAWTPAMAVTR